MDLRDTDSEEEGGKQSSKRKFSRLKKKAPCQGTTRYVCLH